MKKLLFILLMLPATLLAAPVDPNLAQQVAENFINSSVEGLTAQTANQPRKLKRVAKQVTDNPPYYIFNNEEGGFVIVSGDDCATPILGYSNEGCIDLDNMPIQLEELLGAYAAEIQYAVENNLHATEEVTDSWASYKRAPQAQTTTAVVNALITTSWKQYPRYNDKCPVDASLSSLGGHPSTGCVATAMAQIMKYWEYPKKGYGSKSYPSEHYGTLSADFGSTKYDWDNMPLKLSSSTSSTQNNAVATLMYHCGVAVEMEYNRDGDGSSTANTIDGGGGRASAETALRDYFGYVSSLKGKQSSSMSASAWKSLLKTELDNKRPMIYRGESSGGHAFICDGYDSNDKFHFNWGWGGQANGFFSLTALTPGNNDYTQNQCAIIGIKPKDGSSPAKNYDLYMNTDLTATNTSSSTSSEPNAYYYGSNMSFTAKVENNGSGPFDGYLKVGAFTDEGKFIAWSNESYHFTLNAGQNTVQKTYTFTGGSPFLPGKYRAYMYYQDDDETESKLVKTDEGVFLTEYNNVAFTVKSYGYFEIASAYQVDYGSWIVGSTIRINVSVKNTSSSAFKGKIRLCLYDLGGTLEEVIDDIDFSKTAFPANATKELTFSNARVTVEPGSYHLTLQVQNPNQSTWITMGCSTSYPNPIWVDITAPVLYADEYEPNNSQAKSTYVSWMIDPEMIDFSTLQVSLHENADVDYYKLVFPKANSYKVQTILYDKYNQGGMWYENADAQFAYSVNGKSYSTYYNSDQIISFEGPAILYFIVKQNGMNGLGYYELSGEIEETANPNVQDVTCSQAAQIAFPLDNNTPTTETYNVTGYVTETDGVVSYGQQIFWMADTEDGGRVFQCYWGNVPEQIKVGDYVSVKGQILRYNSIPAIKKGDVLLIERKSTEAVDGIEATNSPTKILRNNQIFILRGDKVYTLQGQEIR